jgi:hypothetical protein
MPTVTPRLRPSLAIVAAVLLSAACSGAAVTPGTASVAPSSGGSTPAPRSPASSAAAESPAATGSGGPVDYAAWIERQGFGGSSGLNELAKETHWMQDHPAEVTAFDIQTTLRLADNLASWLDEHAPTACWADYHAEVRATLHGMHDAYVTAAAARTAGNNVPTDVVVGLVKDADTVHGLADPAGC